MSTIYDLLPIPRGQKSPNAYEIFGIEPGEQDMDIVTAKVVSVINHLKSIRTDTDPQLWQQAARLVDQARQTLADPATKKALDAKLALPVAETVGSMPKGESQSRPNQDPLEGLLPDGDPLAPVSSPDRSAPAVAMPPGLFGAPEANRQQPETQTNWSPVETVDRPKESRRRKRPSSNANRLLALMTVALFSIVAILGYFVFFRQGKIEIASTGDKVTVVTDQPGQSVSGRITRPPTESTSAQANSGNSSAPQPNTKPTQNIDPVMGNRDTANIGSDEPDRSLIPAGPQPDKPAEMPATSPPKPEVKPQPVPTPEPTTLGAAEQRSEIDKVRRLIRQSDWAAMKGAAKSLTELKLSAQNNSLAQGLFQLADLATYYRTGIQRAVADLETGEDFAISDSFRVLVVKSAADELTVRYNKKNRSFKLDEFPFSLAHKLASFQVAEGPTFQAAKAAYQAVAPKATDAHRDESIEWLNGIEGTLEGADPERLVQAIESVYPSEEE